eukprot:5771014-Prymnesium_polylepis.1
MQAIGIKKIDFEETFAAFDSNADGMVSLEELETNLHPRTRDKLEAQLNEEGVMEGFRPLVDMAKVFGQFDTDGSGKLSVSELKRALACLGLAKLDMEEVLKSFDEDGDAEISLPEWKANLHQRTLKLMSKKLDERGLIAGFEANAPAASDAPAFDASPPAD